MRVYSFSNVQFLAYLWGIETGMSGNVWLLVGEFLAYLWGIETFFYQKNKKTPSIVFSVPMRNWNKGWYNIWQNTEKVFSVPMRNWNFVRVLNNLIYSHVFSVPMRNWNSTEEWNRMYPVRFLAYLWGIETADEQAGSTWDSAVFSVPMRNWNK